MRAGIKSVFVVLCLFITLQAAAAERQLVYTYIGPVAGAGMNRIHYIELWSWDNYFGGSKEVPGYFLSGGLTIYLIGNFFNNFDFIGDFSIQYMRSRNEKLLAHLYYTASIKLGWTFAGIVTLAPGIGLYLETPPANRGYAGGGGVRVPLALLFNTTFDSKLFLEASFMYGWYGLGQNSTKLFYGITMGYIFKVGKI